MAYKYREEIVGKRFLSVSGYSKLKLDKIGEWGWRAGVIRAATHKDNTHKDLQVLVEYDDVEWQRREWISIYKDSIFHMFLVEHGLVWGHRSDPYSNSSTAVLWPALAFTSLLSAVDLAHNQQPLEFLLDKELTFCDYKQLKSFQEWDVSLPGIRDYLELRAAARRWTEQQDGQRILLATPSVLVGYRVEVYRAEGTTQWYTAVIVGYNEATRDLTVTDDTVLEEHNEDPALVQMRLIGDGVVESIMRGENVGITSRRSRSAVLQAQHQQPSRVVRVTASSAVNTRKPRIGKPTLVSDPVLQTSPEPPDKVLVTTKPIRKRKSSENNEPSCQGASVVATLRLRSTPHYNNHINNSPSSIKEDLENNKHLSRSRKTSGAGTAVVSPNSAAGNNNSSQQYHQQPQRNKKKLIEETNSSKIRNLHVRVEDCLQIAARSEALSVIFRRNSEEKSASRSNLSSTLVTFSTPSVSPTPSATVLDNPTPTTPLTQAEELSSIEGGTTEDESTANNTNLHDSSSAVGSINSGSSPPTPLPTLNTLTPPPTVDVIDLADSASSCDTANSCSGGGEGGDSTSALQLSGTVNTCSAISSDAALDAELLAAAVATASDVDVDDDDDDADDNENEHDVDNLHKSTAAQWKPCALATEDVDKNSSNAAVVVAITVHLHTGTNVDYTAIEATPTSESALTADTVPELVDTTSCADADRAVNVVHVISDNRTVVEELAATEAATFPSATIVTVDASVVGVTAVTECTDRTATCESTETTVEAAAAIAAGSTVTITTRPLRTSEPCGGHPAVVDDERPATPLLQQMYSGGIATGSGRMETSSVGSVGSVGSDSSATTATATTAAATSVATGAVASPVPPNSSAVTGGESLLRFVVAGGGSNGGSDDRSDSGVSSLRSGSSGDERSGSRSSALSSSGDDLIAAQAQQQQQQQTVSQPHQQLVRDREQGGGVVQGGGRSSRSPVTVFGSAGVSGGREEPPVRVWRDPTLQSENEPHIRHIHSIQHQMKLSQSIDQSRKHMYNSLLMSHPSTNPAVAAAAAAGANVSVSSSSNGVASISSHSPLSLATSSSSVTGGSSAVATMTSTLSAAVAAAAVAQHLYNPTGQPQGSIAPHPGLVPPPPPSTSQSASANATAIYAAELMWKQQQQHAATAAAIAASRGASWPPSTSSSAAAAAAAAVQAQLHSVASVAEEERRLLVEREREHERAYQDRERHERLLREQQHDRVRELQAKEQQHMREREQREKQDHHHHTQHSQLHHHQQQQQQQQQRERYEQHERQFRHDQQQRDRERDHLLLREKDQQQQERERQKTQGSAEMVDQHFKESLKRAQHKSSSAAWPLMSIQSPSSASSVSVSQQQQQHRNAASLAAAAAAADEERKRLERLEMLEHMQRVDQQRAAAVADHQQQQQRHHHHHHHLATSTNQINQQRIESSSRYYSSSPSVNQRPSSVPSSGSKAPPPVTEYHPPPAHSRSNSGSGIGPSSLGSTKGSMDKQHPSHPASSSTALPYHHAHVHHPSSQPQHKSNNELSAAAAAAAAAAASLHGYPTYQPTTFFAAATAAAAAAVGREHHNIHHSSSSSGGGGTGHHKGLSQQHHSALKEHAGLSSGLSPSMMAAAVAAAEHKNSVIVKHEKSLGSSSHHLEARSSSSIAHSPGPPKMPPLGGHYLAGGPPTQAHKLYEYRSPTQSPHHLTPSPHHLSGESKNHHRSPSGPPLSSPHHVHHPPPPQHQQASAHHPVHHGLHQQSQQSPQQQQQQPPHHRQSPHGLSPGLVSSQQQQQMQQHSAHGGGRYRTTSEPPVHQSHHVQHYIQQQHLSQRERDREEQRSKAPPGPPGAAYASYPHPSTLSGAGGSIYAPPTDHRLVAGSLINSTPSATTTPPATGGSSSGKPKVSSPAPHQIFGKPSLTPPGTSAGSSAASPIPLTATKVHHLAVSPSPYQQMQPYSLSHNQGMSAAPPPAHSRDTGGSRYMYERYPSSSAKPIIQHGTGSVSGVGQPPLSTISSGATLPTRHHHSHTSAQQPPPPQQSPIHHIPHHSHHVVGHPQLTQQPQYIQPAAHAVQTQPLDLGISSSNNSAKYEPSLSPKRKAITPLQNTAPICLEVKKRRIELTNNAMNNATVALLSTGVPPINIYQQHDPHSQLLVQGQAHTSPQPTPPSVAVLSRVSEPTPLVSTAAATTITTVVNTSLYNHPSTVNTTINLCANVGRNAATVSANMLPHSPGTLSAVLPDVSVTAVAAVTTTSAEGRVIEEENEELSLQSLSGAVPLLAGTTDGTTTDTKSIGLSLTMNMTPPPAPLTPTQVNASNSPVTIKTEPGLIVKTEPGVSIMTELGNISDNDKANRSSPLTTAPTTTTTTQSSSSTYNNNSSYPVRHLKKAWLQRHTTGEHVDKPESSYSCTFPYSAGASSSASGNGSGGVTPSVTTATPTILTTTTREPSMVNSLHNIGSMAVNSINKSKHFQSKSNNRKGTKDSSSLNGDISKDDSSSSDQERGRKSPPKRKPPKVKRRKGIVGRKPSDKKSLKTGSGGGGGSTGGGSSVLGSESGSDSDKDTGSDKDSDSGASITPLKKPSNGNSVTPPVSLNSTANNVLKDNKGQEPRKRGRRPKTKNDKGEEPRIKKAKDQNTENFRGTVGSEDNNASATAAAEAAVAATTAAIAASTLSTIGALTFSSSNSLNTGGVIAPPRDPFRKPPVGQLKKTGETFLQDGPCFEVAPKLAKCRECRWTPNQRSKNMPNIFCRFYAFRRLRYTKNGQLAIAGFSDPHTDAYEDDIKLWLPSSDTPPNDLDLETSRFILRQVGDHFCNLLVQEKEAHLEHMSDDKTIAWKRVVQGVREMCDVCETTLFNFHWACGKCGFVVCLDCYKGRKRSIIKIWCDSGRDRDEYSWLLCTNRSAHEQERLMLTQIIAGDSLNKLGKLMHEMRELWHVDQHCNCAMSKEISLAAMKTNGIRKEMIRGLIKMEMNGMKREIKEEVPQQQNGQKEGWSPSAEMVSSANEDKKNEDSDSEGSYSHLRELLTSSTIRPKQPNGSRAESPTSTQPLPPPSMPPMKKKPKLDSVDEVIFSVIEDSVPRPDSHCNNPFAESRELRHYIPRDNAEMKYRGLLPIRVLTLTESKVLYPCIPHNWLCHGKLLRLSDSTHTGNYRIFQDQWKRGQPVLVSDVTKHMDRSLWTPESFASDFGDEKNDLVNCLTGIIVPNQPMRKFWEGFENFSKRLKDDSCNPMLLKLKDWPPAEDFAEMLPSRFTDLMKVLPLSEYTHRGGRLNLAGRLPDCFVRPDLGPKMYNAYGSAIHPSKGTTNLHLDISDAVNVMVYVGIPKDGNNDEHIKEAFRAIDDAGCDILTKRRIRDKGELPGALWHIYNARDADKIRDLLNKMVVEAGGELKPNHDPIHDQSRYLDGALRERLYKEYGVEGYAIVQCLGDAVFIPAGAPHQVRNLHNCIKVAEDFVSPENVSQCFHLTQEFRELSHAHANHEDKLQIKNIIYHAVKDSLSTLSSILNKHLSVDNTIGTTVPNTSDAKAEIKTEIKSEID